MTNADCIRSMTDEELLSFLQTCFDNDVDYAKTFCTICGAEAKKRDESTDCDGCLRWWLTIDCENHPQGIKYWDTCHKRKEVISDEQTY